VLQVLLAFSEQRPQATISELAEVVGVPLSTCYRYVGLLREMGLLEEGERSTYHVTPQIMHVARAAQLSNTIARRARPVLQRLSEESGETVLLMQQQGSVAVCVVALVSDRRVRLVFEPGYTVGLGLTASGKVLLAFMPELARSAYLAQRAAADPEFSRQLPELERELAECTKTGWATSKGAVEEGTWACAAPVRDGDRAVAAISIAAPVFRIGQQERIRIRDLVLEGAAEVARAAGP
jgi:DNA-binding IclR family transcriptional regulator